MRDPPDERHDDGPQVEAAGGDGNVQRRSGTLAEPPLDAIPEEPVDLDVTPGSLDISLDSEDDEYLFVNDDVNV